MLKLILGFQALRKTIGVWRAFVNRSVRMTLCFGIGMGTLLPTWAEGGLGEDKVLSTSYHRFPRTLPGKILTSHKVLDAITHGIKHVSNDPEIPDAAALYKLLLEERRLEQQELGVLEGGLKEKFNSLKEGERVRVTITLKYPEGIRHPSKLETSQEDLERHSANLLTIQPVIAVKTFFAKYGLQNLIPSEGRSGLCEIPKEKLREVMFDKNVSSVEEYVEFEPARVGNWISPFPIFFGSGYPSFETLARSAYNHNTDVVPPGAGSQVNAATVEIGIAQSFLTCIGITPTYFEAGNDLHSHQTFRCLTFGAPAARFHHRKISPNPRYHEQGTLDFLTNRSIRTASLSNYRTGLLPTYSEFRQMDDFAYKAPYTTFSSPTGNQTWEKEAGWQNYNGLTVGNVQHLNQSTFQINTAGYLSGCTQTRNPAGRYPGSPCLRSSDANYTDCSSDRELPHIVAPGFTPFDGNPMAEPCDATPITCGTSYSAPILSGMVASVIAADSRMDQWPEKVRAALLVTAENVHGGQWHQNTDGLDGVGVVNGAAAVAYAQTHSTVGINWTGVAKGMGFGSINTSNWGTTLSYNIAIPNPIPSGKILRVVLLWDSNPSLNTTVNELSDLDLSVYAALPSQITRSSSSYESNVEVVHFSPLDVQAGTTISASIIKYSNRIPVDATTNYFYYAIAWDWVDDHAP